MKPDRSAVILVLGLLSLLICAPLGVVAWVLGFQDLREIDAGIRVAEGRSTVKGGMICGIIGSILFVLQVLGLVLFLVIFGLAGVVGSLTSAPPIQ